MGFSGNVIFCKTDFLKIPVNEDGKTLTDGIMYQRTVNLLMSTLVTNELRHHDKTETERLINCTSKAENIADHANCHVPYLQMSIDRIDKQIVPPRVKRSTTTTTTTTTTKESSTLERLFNWLRKLFREMRKYSSSTSSWKGSAGDEDDLEDELTKYDVDFDIHLGTNELLANVEKAIAENNFESLLPDMPLPGWFRELAYDVFELIKDMKVIEDIPPLRVLSPRILALTPDANRTIDLLSPDLLSLYEDGSKNVFPTKQSKQMLSRRERDALLNLILELGNVPKLVRDIKRLTMSQRRAKRAQSSRMEKLEKEEALVELGEKFKLLDASLTREQRRSINSTGYAFLSSDQMRLVHNGSLSEEKLFEYVQMTEMDKERWLREELRKIAEEKQLHRRRQRSANKTEEVDVLHPMVQGPRGDEPLVAGHVILNPKIFSPVVLSPNMVSSSILSPLVLSPIILSPMAVNPIVLSPGMLNPLILSPAVLSPLILSPVLLIPSILSPGAFNPSILSPTLLTAAVLSPSALSPVIRSPHRLFAAVLSPSYMSPSINSTCSACAIVASPCFLC
ncbi:Serum response factor-binding protein 1 [Trichinella nelsoni]|uniref:Serum response factor-binding protein 1 n=1 Tax=Trichinella nelsoni TaxID=6336 RepID=A0A0V0RXL2_9BILA|nr:Serum response factor-binding protein 1 [Trichinella nelsoni]